jgi:thiamine phosphate synthase YjbQ (UPF0047 family)
VRISALLQDAAARITEEPRRCRVRENICVATTRREELVDITAEVQAAVTRSAVLNGVAFLYIQGATAALMVQEN